MRLRLTVQRNSLPATNILWNVPDTSSGTAYTITRLLEDVNHIIPLESEHWGLEHYVVEVAGFECLHFSPVAQALKDDDHVSIRPLMTAEVRARTLTGRHQISDDGRHLVDGVPFGRPYLRHPHRPAVRIPPRKRRRLDDGGDDVEVAGLLTEGHEEPEGHQASSALVTGGTRVRLEGAASPKPSGKVQFKQPDIDPSDDSEEDDEDFAPEGDSDHDASMDDISSNDSDSDSDSDGSSEASSSGSNSSDSNSDSTSESDSDSESDASSPPEVLSSKDGSKAIPKLPTAPASQTLVPPGNGRSSTHSRNARRARSNRLRHLKESGELHKDANLSDLQKYEDAKRGQTVDEPEPPKPFAKPSGKRKRLEDDEPEQVINEEVSELEQRKRELMAKLEETSGSQSQISLSEPEVEAPQNAPLEEQPAKRDTPSKRLRPDTTAISRILARQARPTVKKGKTKPVAEKIPEPEGASDPDFWKSRIKLSAFECWEEDFELTAPPYPFQQHWDPASKQMRDKASKKKQKKGGRIRNPLPTEQYEEEDEEEKIVLNYDDVSAAENPDAEIHAALEDQLREDVETAVQADLPPLPEDISTLPDLVSSDIKQGAVIVCKFFAVNPITVTPEISDYKTAIVEREGDSGNGAGTIRLKIADRDLPKKEKKFDNKGNRIYDAGDAFLMEDDEDDEGLWEGMFGELLEGKLLKAV
ncbi:hypothetical protein BKA66DRAFT_606622 [Pyrenochaeta sp. MPI-SDFR-AT-0127]|nr:hypothetical protein BKA66DRAFT_606622 [Pyrenochaeta sp. MPI-SDFR-AT-0127]